MVWERASHGFHKAFAVIVFRNRFRVAIATYRLSPKSCHRKPSKDLVGLGLERRHDLTRRGHSHVSDRGPHHGLRRSRRRNGPRMQASPPRAWVAEVAYWGRIGDDAPGQQIVARVPTVLDADVAPVAALRDLATRCDYAIFSEPGGRNAAPRRIGPGTSTRRAWRRDRASSPPARTAASRQVSRATDRGPRAHVATSRA